MYVAFTVCYQILIESILNKKEILQRYMTESNQTFMKLKKEKKKLRNHCLTNGRVESKKKFWKMKKSQDFDTL